MAKKKKKSSSKSKSSSSSQPAGLFGGLGNSTAPLQSQYNTNLDVARNEANLNRFDEVGPYGSRMWEVDETGRPTAKTSLAPWEQQKYQDQSYLELERNKIAGDLLTPQMRSAYSQGLNFDDITKIPGADDLAGSRQRVEDALYKRYTNRFAPEFKQQEEEFRARMANEGVPEGSEKWNRFYTTMKQSQNDALADAMGRSVEGGAAEQERMFTQGLQGRQQGISEKTFLRDSPYREMSQLMGLNQGPRDQQYTPISPVNIDPVDVTGTVTGFANLANQKDIAKLQEAGANYRAQLAASGRGGGGGGGGLFQLPATPAPPKPKSNPWANIGGAFLGSLAGGFGQSFGASLGGGNRNNSGGGLFGNIFG